MFFIGKPGKSTELHRIDHQFVVVESNSGDWILLQLSSVQSKTGPGLLIPLSMSMFLTG